MKSFNIARYQAYPFNRLICIKKTGVKNIPSTKIEASYNKIQRMSGLDDLARILFPGNRNHQKVFLAIFIAILVVGALIMASYLFYFSDYLYVTSKGVPPDVYDKYFSVKSMSIWDTFYALYACKSNNKTDIFDVTSASSEVNDYYFSSNGTEICENHFVIDCRDHCPDCLNHSVSNCTIILSNYPAN